MTESKQSKHGWPLGKHRHNLGHVWQVQFESLAKGIKSRYGGQVEFVPFATNPRLGEVVLEARLSMETYGLLRAFVAGFNAANY